MLTELQPYAAGPEELALLAAHLRLPTGFEDDPAAGAALASAFDAARIMVERATGRALRLRAFRCAAPDWETVSAPPIGPLRSLNAVSVEDADGLARALATEDFRLDPLADPPRVSARAGVAPPAPPTGGRVVIEVEAGYGPKFEDAPADLRAATLAIAAACHERWSVDGTGATVAEPLAEALLAPYRRVSL